jgi:hypothetical protein
LVSCNRKSRFISEPVDSNINPVMVLKNATVEVGEYMKNTKALIMVAVVLLAGTIMQAQRGGAPRGSVGSGGAEGTRPGAGIGSVGSGGLPDSPDGTTRTANTELRINDKLTAKLKTLLPEGADPHHLSKGFGDLKDFVTTVHASNNLKIPFGELKHKMGDGSAKELQKAIHELKPDADPKAEIKKAGEQAKQDIKESK